ncbi:MAG: ribbon-helix-helix protein, CopG family, partial [Caulobacteraceae bacterium]|nr:ribbon-helix-helix protein, CopG family [Caulobacteraceae bacterium]
MDSFAPPNLARLSVSLPAELLAQLDAMVAERNLPSRSQMIAELIRHELADHNGVRSDAVLA